MLALLFNAHFVYDIITIVAIVGIIWLCIKYPNGRLFMLTALFLVIIGTGVYSIISVNQYYSASGGVYGVISGVFSKNNVVVHDMSYDFKDVMLTANGNGDEYSATFTSEEHFELDSNAKYIILVNGSPCVYFENSADYLFASYTYNFYGENRELLLTDTLYFKVSFYNASTLFIVSTQGGSQAVAMWNYYFNVNNFNVEIRQVDSVYFSDNVANIGDYHQVQFYIGDTLYKQMVILDGEKITAFKNPKLYGYTFNGWTYRGEIVDVFNMSITGDVELHASLIKDV